MFFEFHSGKGDRGHAIRITPPDARMRKFRKGLGQRGATHILGAICRRAECAEYVVKSGVAHRYKAITWGRGV